MKTSIQPIFNKKKWESRLPAPSILQQINELAALLKRTAPATESVIKNDQLLKNHRALFYGPSGSGKKQAASILSKSAGMDVYRIDLSAIVSKYIGETEKNLDLLFAKAENKDWILFFDEADALFGKRSNVKDAHDRYANQEVAYLLQRIESYNGLVILSGNNKKLSSEALQRHFQTVIKFPKRKKKK